MVTRECHRREHDRGGGNHRCLGGFDEPATPNVSPQPGRRHERTHAQEGTPDVQGSVPGLTEADFEREAREGEEKCPVSNAVRNNVEIALTATLEQ